MNTSSVFYKARKTILEMFQDRGYQGNFVEAGNLTVSQFNDYGLLNKSVDDPMPNYIEDNGKITMIDLWGFTEKRTVIKPASAETEAELIEIEVPVYVHFTGKPKPKKTGGVKRDLLYKNLLEDEYIGPYLKGMISKYPDELNPMQPNIKKEDKTIDQKTWIHDVMKEQVMLGVHMIFVYDGWAFSQNKVPKDLFFIYQSSENSPLVYDLEIWPAHTLVLNITKHRLVPSHTLFSKQAQNEFLFDQAKFYLNPEEKKILESLDGFRKIRYLENYFFQLMPKISLHDPINLYYYGRLRQIYQIVREGKSPSFRIVKKSPLLQDQR